MLLHQFVYPTVFSYRLAGLGSNRLLAKMSRLFAGIAIKNLDREPLPKLTGMISIDESAFTKRKVCEITCLVTPGAI